MGEKKREKREGEKKFGKIYKSVKNKRKDLKKNLKLKKILEIKKKYY